MHHGRIGDITLREGQTSNEHIAWSCMRDGGYMQTPIVHGDILCRDNGVMGAFDAKTGARHYESRLGDGKTGFSASAVAANGRLYFTSEDADVYVVKAGPTFEVLATNPLGEVAMATPAISEGTLIFRTRNLKRTGFIGELYLREDGANLPTNQVRPGAA